MTIVMQPVGARQEVGQDQGEGGLADDAGRHDGLDTGAFSDQEEMIEGYGGKEVAASVGAPWATPPPKL